MKPILIFAFILMVTSKPSTPPDIVYIPTGAQVENVCIDGQIPVVVVHHNIAAVRCE